MSDSIWWLYMIRCENGALYTGIATDVIRRFGEHCDGGDKAAKYLKGKKNLKLVYQVEVGTRSEASKLEYRIKHMPKMEKERLVGAT